MGDAMDLSPVSKLTTDFQDLLHSSGGTATAPRRHLFPSSGSGRDTPDAVALNDACSAVPTFKKPLPPSQAASQPRRVRKPLASSSGDRRRAGSCILSPSSGAAPSLFGSTGHAPVAKPSTLLRGDDEGMVFDASASCDQLHVRRAARTHSFSFGDLPTFPSSVASNDGGFLFAGNRTAATVERNASSCPTSRRATHGSSMDMVSCSDTTKSFALPRLTFDQADDDDHDICTGGGACDDESNKENNLNTENAGRGGGASPYRPPLFSLTSSTSAVPCSFTERGRRSGSMTDRSHHHPMRRSSAVALFATSSSSSPSSSSSCTFPAPHNEHRDATSALGLTTSSSAVPTSPYSGSLSPMRQNADEATSPFSGSGSVATSLRRQRGRPARALTMSCSSLPVLAPPLQPAPACPSSGHQGYHSFHREAHVPVLPTNPHASHSDLPCIEPSTLLRLLSGEFDSLFTRIFIIDCRFKYEYDGGHIRGAINLNTTQDVEKQFVLNPIPMREKVCIIFHCEFSSHRGPVLCRYLRSWDRKVHEHCYPELYYPEMYVLEGGYKKFWETPNARAFCEPQAYVPMKDSKFIQEMKSGLASIRNFSAKKNSTSFRSRSWTVDSRDERNTSAIRPVRFPLASAASSPLAQASASPLAVDFED